MSDRRGRQGLLSPKNGDEASFILTSDPMLRDRTVTTDIRVEEEDEEGDA